MHALILGPGKQFAVTLGWTVLQAIASAIVEQAAEHAKKKKNGS